MLGYRGYEIPTLYSDTIWLGCLGTANLSKGRKPYFRSWVFNKLFEWVVERVEFVKGGMSLILQAWWCNVNMHAPVEVKTNNVRYEYYEEGEHTFA